MIHPDQQLSDVIVDDFLKPCDMTLNDICEQVKTIYTDDRWIKSQNSYKLPDNSLYVNISNGVVVSFIAIIHHKTNKYFYVLDWSESSGSKMRIVLKNNTFLHRYNDLKDFITNASSTTASFDITVSFWNLIKQNQLEFDISSWDGEWTLLAMTMDD
ncbi:MAG: hypothetical protein WC284_16840 [Candidimonas sp.]